MIFRWLKRRRELAARVSAEAQTMIALFGDGAYEEARERAGTHVHLSLVIHTGLTCAAGSRSERAGTMSIPPRVILSRSERFC